MQNAINIELSLLDFIDLDLDNEVVTIGPGVENAQLYDLLSSVGKETGTNSYIFLPSTQLEFHV